MKKLKSQEQKSRISIYPISDAKAQELVDIIDNSEYDETTTLQIEISQYAWNGASEIDIIKSWS